MATLTKQQKGEVRAILSQLHNTRAVAEISGKIPAEASSTISSLLNLLDTLAIAAGAFDLSE